MTVRRIAGALILSWCTYRLLTVLATQPSMRTSLDAVLSRWWPLGIVLIALLTAGRALNPTSALRGPAFLALIGLAALTVTTGALKSTSWMDVLIPMVLVPVGWLLVSQGNPNAVLSLTSDWPKIAAVGEVKRVGVSSKFLTHGRVTSVLGAVVVDLRPSQTLQRPGSAWHDLQVGHGAILDLNAIGGTIDLVVPSTWHIDITSSSAGARVDNRVRTIDPALLSGQLRIAALTVAGRVTVRSS
ncbi:hypothetical protein [Kribbella sindirgiensis]|uniref:Cell wall-active antibiotics response LiaF-like C-terminal domain-containing protein n=1 Tax=Kribbella sindirgiensis TaxID=1124744 RepID=A0A4R0I6B4_9ACTN|nr:hypothetical protein [Kribbella sindirgiensis]TCC20005.1 hypothetical protein E0H50_37930 [Kribbella sindirgiensis]